jgi:hypothetical protein
VCTSPRATTNLSITAREKGGCSGNLSPSIADYGALKSGAPMRGVTAYPFDKQQGMYIDQFAPIVASQLVHPYNALTENNADSIAHNIITGSACAPSPLTNLVEPLEPPTSHRRATRPKRAHSACPSEWRVHHPYSTPHVVKQHNAPRSHPKLTDRPALRSPAGPGHGRHSRNLF